MNVKDVKLRKDIALAMLRLIYALIYIIYTLYFPPRVNLLPYDGRTLSFVFWQSVGQGLGSALRFAGDI